MTHPSQALRIRDLSLDFLIDHKIARLLQPEGSPLYDRSFARYLAEAGDRASLNEAVRRLAGSASVYLDEEEIVDEPLSLLPDLQAWAEATGRILLDLLGETPHDPLEPLEHQLSGAPETLRKALALARHGERLLRGPAEVKLPAPLLVREEVPRLGEGPIEIIEVGDFQDLGGAHGHFEARQRLADLQPHITWRWVHGPTGASEQSEPAAAFAEIALDADPARFQEVLGKLYRAYAFGETEHLSEIPGLPEGGIDALLLAGEDRYQERLRQDMAMVNVCAVPPIRPAFVIGTKPFLGLDALDDLRAEVERLAKGS